MVDRNDGLYGKYRVRRINDPKGKHDSCPFFVLDPRHDPHARTALLTYASECESSNPQLAGELRQMAADPHPVVSWKE